MPRPFTRDQALQNAAFLKALRRTGNAREAARALGVHRSTMLKRRAKDPALAAEWDAALAVAHAALRNPLRARSGTGAGAERRIATCRGQVVTAEPVRKANRAQGAVEGPGAYRRESAAPELHIIRTASGRLQLRRPGPCRLGSEAEQAFLAALSATANVRLSAAAAGFSHSAFYYRRKQSPAFAREMRLALQMGYERLEMALIESFAPDSYRHDIWRHNDPPAIPPMSPAQALQLMYLHQKEARLLSEPNYIKRRRGETAEAHSVRMEAMRRGWMQRERENFYIGEAARRARGRSWVTGPKELPETLSIGGWTKAEPEKTPHHEDVALFGGWRLKDWNAREASRKRGEAGGLPSGAAERARKKKG